MTDVDDAQCELSFSANAKLISIVRRFARDFYGQILGDPDVTARLVVATHELLENAVSYSLGGQSRILLSVSHTPDAVCVTIETRNTTAPAHRAALDELLAEMLAQPDRLKFYLDLMRRNAKRGLGSGLGLGRIYAESELDVSSESDGDAVLLRAIGKFSLGAAS